MMKARIAVVLGLIFWGLIRAPAAGAVDLRFVPENQNVAVGAEGTLSVVLDEAIEVRTIELSISFNGSVMTSVTGGSGSAYQALPCFIWEEFTPGSGQWTGFAVSMGSDCFIVGPGELFTWTFTGDANGLSDIVVDAVNLYDRYGALIPVVNLSGTTVVVGSAASAVDESNRLLVPTIEAYPNPFNPLTVIKFWLPEPREAQLGIYDLRGRHVRTLLDGNVPEAWTAVRWDGNSDTGLALPSGVYFYRLETSRERLTGRVTLNR